MDTPEMLRIVGYPSLDAMIADVVPEMFRLRRPLALPAARTEQEALRDLKAMMSRNQLRRSFLGRGYYDCYMPPVIQRNILENPGWYTAYTPYQAEISQGRLEALLNFQTMVCDLTAMEIANASLLDEATAAAEAMTMCHRLTESGSGLSAATRSTFVVSPDCHPQTIAVVQTRAEPLGIRVVVGNELTPDTFGVLLQYPATDGAVRDLSGIIAAAHAQKAFAVVATELLALTLLKPPGEFGADIVVGNSQRFGVPLGYGGPHAAFFATRDAHKRQMPGRLIGVSKDAQGRPALRMALQTREQHIRREKATSNICTSQVLLASMYAVWHGPGSLRRIAERVHRLARRLAENVERVGDEPFFDTIRVGDRIIALDETTTDADVDAIGRGEPPARPLPELGKFARTTPFLTHEVFNRYHTEHEMLRYIHRLESKDLALNTAMIPLGSCTMKLTPTAAMLPLSWPEVAGLHPFVPRDDAAGYHEMFRQLESWLAEITGFAAVSLQPNAGSQGEYAGLLCIRAYHKQRGEPRRVDGDVSLDARRVRGTDRGDLPARSRARRPGLYGRRKHERAGRPLPPRQHRHGRVPLEPAQDVCDPARRRRPRHGSDLRGETSGGIHTATRLRSAVWQCKCIDDFVDVYRVAGRRGTDERGEDGDLERELRREASRAVRANAVQGHARPRRTRVHSGSA